jgi:phenylacetate-coenzyme A ligase PaaK-like adenylate-forming protein
MSSHLQTLIARITAPGGPSFYRRFYGVPEGSPAREVHTLEEWRALPFLTKQSLLETPIAERSFVPHRQLDSLYASSGTTGSLPLFGPEPAYGVRRIGTRSTISKTPVSPPSSCRT